MNSTCNNISFTSRCQSIELARTACRKISLYSTTKHTPVVMDLINNTEEGHRFLTDYLLNSMYNIPYKYDGKITEVLKAYANCNKKLETNRELWEKSINIIGANDLLEQTTKRHLGNCGEGAESISLILNMNGIDNAYCTTLYEGENEVLHEVCVFNKDNSPLTKVDNNKTIIADPWSGIVDFVNNALVQIRNTCSKHLNLGTDKPLSVIPEKSVRPFLLGDTEIKILQAKYPELVINKRTSC